MQRKVFERGCIGIVCMALSMMSMNLYAQTATINGKFEGYKTTDTLQVYIQGNSSIDAVQIGEDGTFTISQDLTGMTEALFFLTGRGGQGRDHSCAALLTPGETIGLNISISTPDADGKSRMIATFTGDDAAKPTYANQFYNTISQGSDLSGAELLKTGSFNACQKRVDEVLAPLYATLEGVKDADFKKQATEALGSRKDAAYFEYATAAEAEGKKMEADVDFMMYTGTINPDDTLQLTRIQNYVSWYIAAHPDAYSPLEGDAAQLKHLSVYSKNPDVINKVIDAYIQSINLYAAFGVSASNPAFKEIYEQIVQISTKADHISFAKEQLAKMENTVEGQPAISFTLEDMEGKTLDFTSLVGNGTVTYVDFWATWCGPCKREIPYLATMVEELKDNQNIRIVSISIDEDHDAWRKMVGDDKPAWEQYLIPDLQTSAAIKDYEINSIPRFMIFDKEGNLYKSSASRPSEASTKAQLLELAQ